MVKLPRRPDIGRLERTNPVWRVLPAGSKLWRIYFRGGRHPVAWDEFRHFGPTDARFDHHDWPQRLQERAVLYTASAPIICIAEVFQRTRVINRQHKRPWLVGFRTKVPVRLLDLRGSFPTRVGASMALMTGSRSVSRSWAHAFYSAYPKAAGLLYPSSMYANRPAMVLTDRAEAARVIPTSPIFHRALSDPALLGSLKYIAGRVDYLLHPS